jgi:TRAP-type mannitol/chloroaromatic compound transport system substrate-binding protein
MQSKHGVIVKRWPDETLAKFEKAWFEVVAEESAKDPLFKKVADHFYAFRAKYKVWGEAQSLKGTYLK